MTRSPFLMDADDDSADRGPATPQRVITRAPTPPEPSRRARRRSRRDGGRHGRRGLPPIAANTPGGTPGVDALEARYQAESIQVLQDAIEAARPLRRRRRELHEWIGYGEHRLAEAVERRAGIGPRPTRGRARGEEHLTETDLAGRAEREHARAIAGADIDVRNHRTLLTERRIALREIEDELDRTVDAALIQIDAVRWRVSRELCEYVDELVRHHPEGQLLSELTWPTGFAEPPAWAREPEGIRRLVWGRPTADQQGGDDRASF